MDFYSPTKGKLSFEAVFEDITRYSNENPEDKHKLIIGTDSHAYTNRSVVCYRDIIHRIGKGDASTTVNEGPATWKVCASGSL